MEALVGSAAIALPLLKGKACSYWNRRAVGIWVNRKPFVSCGFFQVECPAFVQAGNRPSSGTAGFLPQGPGISPVARNCRFPLLPNRQILTSKRSSEAEHLGGCMRRFHHEVSGSHGFQSGDFGGNRFGAGCRRVGTVEWVEHACRYADGTIYNRPERNREPVQPLCADSVRTDACRIYAGGTACSRNHAGGWRPIRASKA